MTQDSPTIFGEFWICTVMSDILLDKILAEAVKKISKDMREQLNLKRQTAIFSPDILRTAVLAQLNFTYADKTRGAAYPIWKDLDEADQRVIVSIINRIARKVLNKLYADYNRLQRQKTKSPVTVRVSKQQSDGSFEVTIHVKRGRKLSGTYNTVNPYTKLREGFIQTMNEVWELIGKAIVKRYERRGNKAAQEELDKFKISGTPQDVVFNLGHSQGSSVAEKQVAKGSNYIYNQLSKAGLNKSGSDKLLEALNLEIIIQYKSTKGKTQLLLSVESAKQNKSEGTTILSEGVSKILSDKQAIYEIAGSDNRVEIEKKRVLKAFNEAIVSKRKLTTRDTTLKLSNKKRSKKTSVKSTVNASKPTKINLQKEVKKKIIKARAAADTSTISLPSIMALINSKLPAAIMKNMQGPRLQNRTGRFASSVELLDVTQTKQGYPSIGYTYQKSPYQVFEDGAGKAPWANGQRDPRKLIDRSIRDVAKDILVGRFYTRRL